MGQGWDWRSSRTLPGTEKAGVTHLIVVQGQTQLALVRAQMVLHEIRVLVDVDGLQGQLPEALPAVSVALRGGGYASTPGLSPGAMLEVHGEGVGALPHW